MRLRGDMNNGQKRVLGIILIFVLLIGYALLADAARDNGAWIWIVLVLILVGLILPALQYERYRQLLIATGKGTLSLLANFLQSSASTAPEETKLDRVSVPPALRQKVMSRSNNRCCFPDCKTRGRKNLHVHHIDMDSSNSRNEDNLLALCPNHHSRAHNDHEITIRDVRSWSRGRYRRRSR